ncbi:DegV family protein with EDD domain [Lactobacillus colini]|uniref:DegV family protein with EDD domain n=1 Tax=Lactobacillus colini TaxID=1819254 RepID=A0ABS4MF79_9LACO|nr:DegV family protein [Lactobacillus colini]MBP2058022.1 DegV family protein with EDD domain [Lactobacillus colini]
MKIGVLTDSSAYLTKEQCNEYNISVIPIPIIWNQKTYYDLVDIGFDEFYQKLNTSKELPTTSQPSIGAVKKYVDQYVEQGYTDLIVITISSGLSSFYSNVVSVANEENRIKIHPFDTKITCAGQADAALLAAKLIKAGAGIDLIMHDLEDLRNTTDVRFIVDNLNHLKRTGRLSNAASFVGILLKISPILSIDVQNKGKISAIAKERKYRRAYNHIEKDFSKLISDLSYPVQATIFHADDINRENDWLSNYKERFPDVNFYSSIIGPVVGVHVGQHAIAMIWCRNIESYFDKNGKPLSISQVHSEVVDN